MRNIHLMIIIIYYFFFILFFTKSMKIPNFNYKKKEMKRGKIVSKQKEYFIYQNQFLKNMIFANENESYLENEE